MHFYPQLRTHLYRFSDIAVNFSFFSCGLLIIGNNLIFWHLLVSLWWLVLISSLPSDFIVFIVEQTPTFCMSETIFLFSSEVGG